MKKHLFAFTVLSSMSLFGCLSNDSNEKTSISKAVTNDYHEAVSRRSHEPAIRFGKKSELPYVTPLKVKDIEKPKWFFNRVSRVVHAKIGIVELVESVTGSDYVFTKLLDGIERTETLQVNLQDVTVEEILEYISHYTGYSYSATGQSISWSRFQVKSIDLAWLPGKLNFSLGKKMNGMSQSFRGGGGIDSGQAGFKEESANEYITTEGAFDLEEEIAKIIPMFISDKGQFHFDSANTSLVVKDYPRNIEKLEAFINQKNEELSRQVAIDVEVIDVEISSGSQLGLDWTVVKDEISNLANVNLVTEFAESLVNTGSNPMVFQIRDSNAEATGTGMLIKALKSQGAVSKRTYPRVVTMNNRVGKIRSIDRQSYIQRRSIQSTANVGAQASIIQGNVETGFILYALPKILQNDDVIMRLTTSLSSLLEIESKGEGDQRVESPRVTDKDFDNTIVIKSGNTLLIAGLSTKEQNENDASNGFKALGFNEQKKNIRVETILAITPRILRGRRE